MRMDPGSEVDRRFRFMIYRPLAEGHRRVVALDLPGLTTEQVEQIAALTRGRLGVGFVASVDDEVVARGPALAETPAAAPAPAAAGATVDLVLDQTRRLTELAVQQHEYCYAELQRLRRDYEEEFQQERAVLRQLRQRWLEAVCDPRVGGEDVVRYIVDKVGAAISQNESSG